MEHTSKEVPNAEDSTEKIHKLAIDNGILGDSEGPVGVSDGKNNGIVR